MRPVRIIHLDGLRYKYISVTQSKTKMVVRVLMPVELKDNISSNEILGCEKLKWGILNLDGQCFQVIGEGIFDLENPLHRSWFQPNANLCFIVNHAFANGDIAVVPMHIFAAGREKTPDWANRNGYEVIAQLYCWSATDTIEDCTASFAVDNQGIVFTNINQDRMVHVDRKWMQRKDRSDFLAIMYDFTVSSSNQAIICKVECKDYLGNSIDVNGIYKLECTCGYLPQNQITMVHGKCEFLWVPLMVPKNVPITIFLKDSQNFVCKELSFNLE